MLGRKPTPFPLKVIQGTAKADEAREHPQPLTEQPDCPVWLSEEARAHWDYLCPELAKLGLLWKISAGVLAMLAQTWARYVWAETEMARLDRVEGKVGAIDRTPQGYKVQSVYLQISNKALEQYKQLMAEFGLTPAAMPKVQINPQLNLFPTQGSGDGDPQAPAAADDKWSRL
jgi:P27 family predicted phage terminase small subunit